MSVVFQRLCVADGEATRGIDGYAKPMRESFLVDWSREDSGAQDEGPRRAGSKRREKAGSLFALRNRKE